MNACIAVLNSATEQYPGARLHALALIGLAIVSPRALIARIFETDVRIPDLRKSPLKMSSLILSSQRVPVTGKKD